MVDHGNAVRIRRQELAGALAIHDGAQVALCAENLARAVAREEIERATGGAIVLEETAPWPRPSPEPAKPAGVRVRVTEEAVEAVMPEIGTSYDSERYDVASRAVHAAAPHMEVTVDREFLRSRLERWAGRVVTDSDAETFATMLGLTLTDGDNDGES